MCPAFLQLLEIVDQFPCLRYNFPTMGSLDRAINQGVLFFLVRVTGTLPSLGQQDTLLRIWIMETGIKSINIDLTPIAVA